MVYYVKESAEEEYIMKKTAIVLFAAAMLLTACSAGGTSGAGSEPQNTQSAQSSAEAFDTIETGESVTPTADASAEGADSQASFTAKTFRTGTWYGDRIYHFTAENSGATLDYEYGIGVAFEYEQTGEGEYVFHMAAADNNTPAKVEIFDNGLQAVITWEDGTMESLAYASEEFIEPDADPADKRWFTPGTWDGDCRYFFYAETDGAHTGSTRDFTMGIGVPFNYEQVSAGRYLFRIAAADNITPAAVVFSDDGTEAAVTWNDGRTETLRFVSEEYIEVETAQSDEAVG